MVIEWKHAEKEYSEYIFLLLKTAICFHVPSFKRLWQKAAQVNKKRTSGSFRFPAESHEMTAKITSETNNYLDRAAASNSHERQQKFE